MPAVRPRTETRPLARRLGPTLASFALLVGVPGCFAITDLDKYHNVQDTTSPGQFQDFRFSVRAMTSHVNELFEFRIIDANNIVQCRGIVSPLGGPDVALVAPSAIPKVNGPYRLDFYADHDNSGGYDGPDPKDHSWRLDPLADFPADDGNPGTVTVVYDHNRSFTDINEFPRGKVNPPTDTNVGAKLKFSGMGEFVGKMLNVRVLETGTGHLAGMYRVGKIGVADFELAIPGIIDAGVDYQVDVYVDANGNGTYESPANPGGDKGWRVVRPSDRANGMLLDFKPTDGPGNIDVGAP